MKLHIKIDSYWSWPYYTFWLAKDTYLHDEYDKYVDVSYAGSIVWK